MVARAAYEEDQAVLRALRMGLREITTRCGCESGVMAVIAIDAGDRQPHQREADGDGKGA